MFKIPEELRPIQALNPAADAAGRTGVYISLKNLCCVSIVVDITQGHATPPALTIEQATAVAGTSSKAITNTVPIYINLDTSASDALTRVTDAVSYTPDVGLKNKKVVFCIDPAKLDINNGFDCIVLKTGASNAANIIAASYIVENAYQGVTQPSAIVD